MRINTICNTSYQTKNNTFGTYHRDVEYKKFLSKKTLLSHRNDTCFFRDNKLWSDLCELLEQKFDKAKKVNIYSYGCSEGSEAYSFVMLILSKLENKAEKYLPVIAKDFDPYIIEKARLRDWYFIRDDEKTTINEHTGNCYNRFFKEISPNFAYATDELYDNVKFSVSDINKDYKNIEPDNSVIFVRNFWPYLKNDGARQNLLNKLFSKLNKGSLLVIGQYDLVARLFQMEMMLEKAGFKPTKNMYIYEK